MAIVRTQGKSWYNPTNYEFGISEKISDVLGRNRTSSGGSNLIGANAYTPPQQSSNHSIQQYNLPSGSPGGDVLGASTTAGGGSGSYRPATSTPSLPQPQIQSPDQGYNNGPSELDLINSEYDNFQNFLGGQEGLAKQRFADTESAITSERDTALKDTEGQRTIRGQELDQKSAAGRATERLNLQKVRQLLQDLEQKNAARIAVTGGGGSTTEALADRFARTAQQNVGGVLQEGQRYQGDVNIERTRANQFYDTASQKIKDTARASIDAARFKLNENLSNIDAERRDSAQEKARSRYDAWRNYYAQVNQARIQAANFQAQYDLWLQGKNQEIAAANSFQLNPIQSQDFSSFTDPNAYAAGSAGVGATDQNQLSYAPTFLTRYRNPDEQDQFGQAVA